MTTAVAPITGTATWNLDAAHSKVAFKVKHLMISTVRGHFNDIKATVEVDESNPASAKVEVTIGTASIDTSNEQRDGHLRSPDFFDAENHPTITFAGKRLEKGGSADFRLVGDLTVRGVTREIALDVTDEGRGQDPWGGTRAGFTITGKLNRGDFGLTWNAALETGGVLVGKDITITLDLQGALQQD